MNDMMWITNWKITSCPTETSFGARANSLTQWVRCKYFKEEKQLKEITEVPQSLKLVVMRDETRKNVSKKLFGDLGT